MKWYRHHSDAWLAGVTALTPEERGVYQTIIDLLYDRNGDLPIDDDRFFARHCNCDPRTWRRVRDSLVRQGKLYYKAAGNLMARRVEEELERSRRLSEEMTKLIGKRWKNKSKPNTAPYYKPEPE